MKPNQQFTSVRNIFRATEIAEAVIGCTGIYQLYNLDSNILVGKIYGYEARFVPAANDCSLSGGELIEIAALLLRIKNALEEAY